MYSVRREELHFWLVDYTETATTYTQFLIFFLFFSRTCITNFFRANFSIQFSKFDQSKKLNDVIFAKSRTE